MKILTSSSDFVAAVSPAPSSALSPNLTPPPAKLGLDAPPETWQQHMKWAVRSLSELKKRLNLPENLENTGETLATTRAIGQFPVFVPLPYLARIRPADPHDPLLRQVLPTAEEAVTADQSPAGYTFDPLAESEATRSPGLLHKYQGRVLLVTTGACAINCRYCFRRHFPYEASPKSPQQWKVAIDQIAAETTIEEVILSGGDPLTLVDETLAQLIMRLNMIGHLKRLRIHTRLPIMIPQRITDRLLEILTASPMQTIMVIHSNHARELDSEVQTALQKISRAGVMLLNQSVLLKGINDDANTLIELSERLLECQVIPYYLHKNDPVVGTAHFEVNIERGIELIEVLRAALPGYAVPRFVHEQPGQPNKTVLA